MARGRARKKAPHPEPRPRPANAWWRPALVVLSGLIAYANSLAGPFILDDYVSIVDNLKIRDLSQIGAILAPAREMPTAGRPLVNLSIAVNYALGGLEVRGYHVFNLACHLVCGFLLFGVVRRTLELPRLRARFGASALNLACVVAVIWTVHPLNTEAVDYLTERSEVMMALCYLLTLYAAIRAWDSRPRVWRTIALLSCAAGMACKESMVTAPLIVMLYDAIFVSESPWHLPTGRWKFYGALAASWLLLVAVNWSGPRIHSAGFSAGVSPLTYLLNQTALITRYLWLAIWPRSLVVFYGGPAALTLRDVLPYVLFVTALFGLAIVALVRWPAWGFPGAWFFATLAPASSIVPIATEVGAERRMYLPLMALVVIAVVGGWLLLGRLRSGAEAPERSMERSLLVVPSILAVIVLLLMAGTVLRNHEYASPLDLYRITVARYPTSVGHHFLAIALLDAGDREQAMSELRQALPGDPRAHYTLGRELLSDGKVDEAIDELTLFVRDQPLLLEAVPARIALGKALDKEQRWSEAIEQANKVLGMNPSLEQQLDVHALLADALYGAGKFDDAIREARVYLRVRPNAVPVLQRLGVALIASDKLDEAVTAFRRIVEIEPRNGEACRNLANALYDQGNFAEAVTQAEQAAILRPSDPASHDLLGRALGNVGRFDEARVQFERALQIDPDYTDSKDNLVRLQALTARGKR